MLHVFLSFTQVSKRFAKKPPGFVYYYLLKRGGGCGWLPYRVRATGTQDLKHKNHVEADRQTHWMAARGERSSLVVEHVATEA